MKHSSSLDWVRAGLGGENLQAYCSWQAGVVLALPGANSIRVGLVACRILTVGTAVRSFTWSLLLSSY